MYSYPRHYPYQAAAQYQVRQPPNAIPPTYTPQIPESIIDPFTEMPEPFQAWIRTGYNQGRALMASKVTREKAQVLYHEFHTIYEMLYQIGYMQAASYYKRLSDVFHSLYYGSPVSEIPPSFAPVL